MRKCHPHCNSVHSVIQELLDLGPLILSISSLCHACFVFICEIHFTNSRAAFGSAGHASPDSSRVGASGPWPALIWVSVGTRKGIVFLQTIRGCHARETNRRKYEDVGTWDHAVGQGLREPRRSRPPAQGKAPFLSWVSSALFAFCSFSLKEQFVNVQKRNAKTWLSGL